MMMLTEWMAVLVLLAAPIAQTTDTPAQVDSPGESKAEARQEPPIDDPADTYQTAEEALEALRHKRPSNEIVRPSSQESVEADAAAQKRLLLPEGSTLVDMPATLLADGSWWTLVFESKGVLAHARVMRLLPNANLESMVGMATSRGSDARFVVTAETTTFYGENYLLARMVTRAGGAPEQSVSQEPGNASEPAPAPDGPASALQTAAQMKDLRPPARPITPSSRASGHRRVSPGASRPLLPQGTPIIHRPGRLIRAGDSWTFAFESDHPDHPEPPLGLLPSIGLETMIEMAGGGSDTVFLVSGEVTVFHDENYLLLKVVTYRADLGNLHR